MKALLFVIFSTCCVGCFSMGYWQNQRELDAFTAQFNNYKHPEHTKSIYQKNFFGNLGGTGNSCAFAILQIRKYEPGVIAETDIESFYKEKYPILMVQFIKTIEDCCKFDINDYRLYCMGTYANNQPEITYENANDILPVYTLEMIMEGGNTFDSRCH